MISSIFVHIALLCISTIFFAIADERYQLVEMNDSYKSYYSKNIPIGFKKLNFKEFYLSVYNEEYQRMPDPFEHIRYDDFKNRVISYCSDNNSDLSWETYGKHVTFIHFRHIYTKYHKCLGLLSEKKKTEKNKEDKKPKKNDEERIINKDVKSCFRSIDIKRINEADIEKQIVKCLNEKLLNYKRKVVFDCTSDFESSFARLKSMDIKDYAEANNKYLKDDSDVTNDTKEMNQFEEIMIFTKSMYEKFTYSNPGKKKGNDSLSKSDTNDYKSLEIVMKSDTIRALVLFFQKGIDKKLYEENIKAEFLKFASYHIDKIFKTDKEINDCIQKITNIQAQDYYNLLFKFKALPNIHDWSHELFNTRKNNMLSILKALDTEENENFYDVLSENPWPETMYLAFKQSQPIKDEKYKMYFTRLYLNGYIPLEKSCWKKEYKNVYPDSSPSDDDEWF